MREAGSGGGYGFWTGVLAGMALCGAIALGAALMFPPPPAIPPELAPEAARAPQSPAAPQTREVGENGPRTLIRTQSPGPLIADRRGGEMPAGLAAPEPARGGIEDAAGGSPSLVPRNTQ